MTALLTALEFDKEAYPLSPHMVKFTIHEEFKRVVVTGYGDTAQANNFTVPLSHKPQLTDRPEGSYSLLVTKDGKDNSPIVVFSAKDLRSGALEPLHRMPLRNFLSDFEAAYLSRRDAQPDAVFETEWTAAYLQARLGHAIEGDKPFWRRLHKELDMAIVPLNARLAMLDQQINSKELVIQTKGVSEYPKAGYN